MNTTIHSDNRFMKLLFQESIPRKTYYENIVQNYRIRTKVRNLSKTDSIRIQDWRRNFRWV